MTKYNEATLIKILKKHGYKPIAPTGVLPKDWVQLGLQLAILERLDEMGKKRIVIE